jgi:hypothetical protein
MSHLFRSIAVHPQLSVDFNRLKYGSNLEYGFTLIKLYTPRKNVTLWAQNFKMRCVLKLDSSAVCAKLKHISKLKSYL